MSTKGMSVRAARQLIDELHRYNVPVFVLHDLDKVGFSLSVLVPIVLIRLSARSRRASTTPEHPHLCRCDLSVLVGIHHLEDFCMSALEFLKR